MKLKLLLEEKTIKKMHRIYRDENFDALIKTDSNGKWIYRAGEDWKKFDYEKGLKALIKKDKNGEYIYLAGKGWKSFDHEKGLKVLRGTAYYDSALKYWPRGIKMSQAVSKNIKDTAKKLPKKELKL